MYLKIYLQKQVFPKNLHILNFSRNSQDSKKGRHIKVFLKLIAKLQTFQKHLETGKEFIFYLKITLLYKLTV